MKNAKWENWTNFALGIWLFLTPWVMASGLTSDMAARGSWNSWLVGAVIAISAAMALQDLKPWEELVNLALGIWMILSPWIFGYTAEPTLFWNSIIVGAAVVVFSGLSIPVAQKLQYQK